MASGLFVAKVRTRQRAGSPDTSKEFVRLARALAELMPDEPEVIGLLALLLLTEARRPARVGPSGELVVLAEQDRSLWNRELIAEGHELALYDEAIALATNDTERTFLETRRARLTPDL